jgi:hypothetical protein
MTDGPFRIWIRAEERFGDDPELVARMRAEHDLGSIVRNVRLAMEEYLLETGRAEMMQAAINQDLDREEAGEPPLPKLELSLPHEDAIAIADRALYRMRGATLGGRGEWT